MNMFYLFRTIMVLIQVKIEIGQKSRISCMNLVFREFTDFIGKQNGYTINYY